MLIIDEGRCVFISEDCIVFLIKSMFDICIECRKNILNTSNNSFLHCLR